MNPMKQWLATITLAGVKVIVANHSTDICRNAINGQSKCAANLTDERASS